MLTELKNTNIVTGIVNSNGNSYVSQTIPPEVMERSYRNYLYEYAPVVKDRKVSTIDEMAVSAMSIISYGINANVEYAKKQIRQEFDTLKFKYGLLDCYITYDSRLFTNEFCGKSGIEVLYGYSPVGSSGVEGNRCPALVYTYGQNGLDNSIGTHTELLK